MSFVARSPVMLFDCELPEKLLVLALFKLAILLFDNCLLSNKRLKVS